MTRAITRISLCLLFACAFVLGIKQLREPDFWWMLRTGEWILENGKVPDKDVFSYTFEGVSWINVKWGFEVLLAILAKGGVALTLLLQSLVNVLLVWVIYRTVKLTTKNQFNLPVFVFTGLVLLFGTEFRMNGRPEMISHLFTAVFLLYFLQYLKAPSGRIYLLALFQVIWANMHEAYGTGMVMMLAFTGATAFAHVIGRKTLNKQDWIRLVLVTIMVIIAPAIHPYGVKMIWHPYEIFTQVGENKFTTELAGIDSPLYWEKEAYLYLICTGIVLLYLFIGVRKAKDILLVPLEKSSVGYLVLLALFFYLGLTAYRNIPFFLIVAMPFLYEAFAQLQSWLVRRVKWLGTVQKIHIGEWKVLLLVTAFYVAIVSDFYYEKIDNGRDAYGLKVNPYFHPIGATDAIPQDKRDKHNFSDFLVSNYPLWKLQPVFKTYIDLRDLDIFTAEFTTRLGALALEPDSMRAELHRYDIQYALLTRANFSNLHNFFYHEPGWRLHYVDAVAAVFLLDTISSTASSFSEVKEMESPGLAYGISKLFNPFYTGDFDALDKEVVAASYFMSVGDMKKAESELQKAAKKDILYYKTLAAVYYQQALADTSAARMTSLQKAEETYQAAQRMDKNDDEIWLGLGLLNMEKGNMEFATNYLKRAVKINPANKDAWFNLAQVENMFMRQDVNNQLTHLKRQAEYMGKAYDLDRNNIMLRFYYGVLLCQLDECEKGTGLLEDLLQHPAIGKEDREIAKTHYDRCMNK